jgi:hypothetical protein
MDTTSSNLILQNSFLGSQWFNPDYLFNQVVSFFQNLSGLNPNNYVAVISLYHTILFFLSIFFLTLISYCSVRIFEIRRKEHEHVHHEIDEYAHHQAQNEKKSQQEEAVSANPRWIKTLGYLFSQHESDWKLAVIEADAMLESLMNQLGFKGETFGDKLKSANQDNFHSLTSAWEVHNIRNRIAHEGAAFPLSQHEAKRVIALYEQIFREFGFI